VFRVTPKMRSLEIVKRHLLKKQMKAAGIKTRRICASLITRIARLDPLLHAGSGRAESGTRDCEFVPQSHQRNLDEGQEIGRLCRITPEKSSANLQGIRKIIALAKI
jgi:hypothetical protein